MVLPEQTEPETILITKERISLPFAQAVYANLEMLLGGDLVERYAVQALMLLVYDKRQVITDPWILKILKGYDLLLTADTIDEQVKKVLKASVDTSGQRPKLKYPFLDKR